MRPIESRRVALNRRIVLRFPDFDGFVTEYAANLSMTGMFVRSREPQDAGTPVSFELRLESGAPLVRGKGWVVWSRSEREGADRPAGMGVEFTELDHKSRRLVRWMILNQLPEDQGPYDVRTGTATAPTTARLVSRSAARRSRRAGVLTAIVILAALAAVVYWGGSSRSGLAAPSAAGREAEGGAAPSATESISEAVGAGEVMAGGGGSEPGEGEALDTIAESATGAAVAAAESTVRSWARAWSDQDVELYLSHYSSDFVPALGLSRRQWSKLRRQRLTAPRSIRVAVTRLETRIASEGGARVSFLQIYRSDGYSDTVDKVLELGRENGVWKIRHESAD